MEKIIWLSENCYVDLKSEEVYRAKRLVKLPNGYPTKLAFYLIRNENIAVTYEQIYDAVWELDYSDYVGAASNISTTLSRFITRVSELKDYICVDKERRTYTFRRPSVEFSPVEYYKKLFAATGKAVLRDTYADAFKELVETYVQPKCTRDPEGHIPLDSPVPESGSFKRLILAPSGYGKTTMLRAIAVSMIVDTLAKQSPSALDEKNLEFYQSGSYRKLQSGFLPQRDPSALLPIFIEVKNANRADFGSLLNLAVGSDLLYFSHLVRSAHRQGKLLILLDGIDEVEPDFSGSFYTALRNLLIEECPNASLLVTGRFRGILKDYREFVPVYLQKFDPENIRRLLNLLITKKTTVDGIMERVENKHKPYWCQIFSNPHLATTVVYSQNISEPENLTPFIMTRTAVDTIIHKRWRFDSDISAEDIKQLLAYTAWVMIQRGRESISPAELSDIFLEAKEKNGDFIHVEPAYIKTFAKTMGSRSGILTLKETSGTEEFQFQSSLMMYYLAGIWLAHLWKSYMEGCSRSTYDRLEKWLTLCEAKMLPDQSPEKPLKTAVSQYALFAAGVSSTSNRESSYLGHMLALSRMLHGSATTDTLSLDQTKMLVAAVTTLNSPTAETALIHYLLYKCVLAEGNEKQHIQDALLEIVKQEFGINRVTNSDTGIRKYILAFLQID